MFTIIVFLLVVLAGNVLGVAVTKKNRAEYVALTVMTDILIIYLCGLLEVLRVGVFLVLAGSFFIYVYSFYCVTKAKEWKKFLKELFSPYIVLLLLIFFGVVVGNFRKIVTAYDDLSHWGLAVKQMCQFDVFTVSSNASDYAPTYPPAMACFQYFVQELRQLLQGQNTFSEWWLFVVYQFATYIFLFPLMTIKKGKNVLEWLLNAAVVFVLPVVLFQYDFINNIYVDTFLSVTAAYVLFVMVKPDISNVLKLCAVSEAMAILVLTKDVGLILGGGLALTYFVVVIWEEKEHIKKIVRERGCRKKILCGMIPMISLLIAKITWSYKVNAAGIGGASTSVSEMAEVLNVKNIVLDIFGINKSYKHTSFVNYCNAFFDNTNVRIGDTNISISFFTLFILLSGLILLLGYSITEDIKQRYIYILKGIGSIFTVVLYLLAQGIFYMYLFWEGESVSLASYKRYISIPMTFLIIVAIIYLMLYMESKAVNSYKACMVLIGILACVPTVLWVNFFNRELIGGNVNSREIYKEDIALLSEVVDEDESVYIVYLDQDGFKVSTSYFTIFFECNTMKHENDPWSTVRQQDAESWMDYLIENEHDYVYLRAINEEFVNIYGSDFEQIPPSDIERKMYYVDRENRLLREMN